MSMHLNSANSVSVIQMIFNSKTEIVESQKPFSRIKPSRGHNVSTPTTTLSLSTNDNLIPEPIYSLQEMFLGFITYYGASPPS